MKIRLSKLALSDLSNIKNYIKKDSSHYAKVFIQKILSSIKILKDFPEIVRVVPEYNIETVREIFIKSYRIIYRLENDIIFIVTVIHGSRLLKKLLKIPGKLSKFIHLLYKLLIYTQNF